MIRIQVPATSANLGPGFDSLGIALNIYNPVWLEESDVIDISSVDNIKVPNDKSNLIYSSANRLYEECGKKLTGLVIKQKNNIPMARGLGSSSACIAAGLAGANHLLGYPLSKNELISLACKIEGHPDNTTPAITGGFTVSAIENNKVYSISNPIPNSIKFAAIIPPFELKTNIARGTLPENYSKHDVVYNISRSCLMTASLLSGNLENLKVAAEDKLHQPYRKSLIPNINDIFNLSYELGAYATYISGAGPTIISIIDDCIAENFSSHAIELMHKKNIDGWQVLILNPDNKGVTISTE